MQNLRHPAVVCLLGVAVLPPNSSPNGSTPSGSAPPPAGPSSGGSRGVLLLEYCEARDLYRALQLEAPSAGTGAGVAPPAAEGSLGAAAGGSSGGEGAAKERLFGWRRRGRRVAYDCARGLAYLHSKGGEASASLRLGACSTCGCCFITICCQHLEHGWVWWVCLQGSWQHWVAPTGLKWAILGPLPLSALLF